ncbi:hypothetical protein Ahy_A04g021440 [Arachis hypogaea]|uniref:Zinc finger GRF-type domain-containing protein n=1 Tax=Arachis hypogaea TaxID=3818 RepID=A0A445DKE7_ARAHY|nr:hypothetical protein Ahy_A04g021440 [Arachis hypogaea]
MSRIAELKEKVYKNCRKEEKDVTYNRRTYCSFLQQHCFGPRLGLRCHPQLHHQLCSLRKLHRAPFASISDLCSLLSDSDANFDDGRIVVVRGTIGPKATVDDSWLEKLEAKPLVVEGEDVRSHGGKGWHISMPAWRRVAGDKICFHIGRKFLTNCTMGSVGGGRSRQASLSHGSHASSSSLRWRRKNSDQVCFCGLKTVIKMSGTRKNPDRLFHACPRYRVSYECSLLETSNYLSWILTFWHPDVVQKRSHCNYFRWAKDDEYEALEHLGEVKTDAEMESDAAFLNHNISWRMMTLEPRYFGLIVVIVFFMIMCMFFSGK